MSVRNAGSDRELVEYIITYTEENGFPPSRRQMAAHMGWPSQTTAEERLEGLVKEGIVERVPGVPRGIRINRQRVNELS